MSHLLLRALNAPLLIMILMIGVSLQTSLFISPPLSYFQPDLLLIAVIWFSLKRSFVEGGILTIILGNLTEIHSGSPQGLYLSSYMFIFLAIRAINLYFLLNKKFSLIWLSLGSLFVSHVFILGILELLDPGRANWLHSLLYFPASALAQAVTAYWMFIGLEKFDWNTFKDPRARRADDELQLDDEGL